VFLIHALRFGSSFDPLLQKMNRRASYETLLFGLISMYISGSKPYSADFLNQASPHAVSVSLDIPIHESKALEFAKLGGVYQDVDGPLKPFADSLCKQMHELGMFLRSRGFDHLGELIPVNATAQSLVDFLVKNLPLTFKDEAFGFGFNVKAKRLAAEFSQHFNRFPLPDKSFALFVDAELVAACRQAGLVRTSQELSLKIASGQALIRDSNEEAALRAATQKALTMLVDLSQTDALSVQRFLLDRYHDASLTTRIPIHLCATSAY